MNNTDIESRLVNLSEKLKRAETHIKLTRPLNSDARITNAELYARYNELLEQVGHQGSGDSNHHVVKELEHSIRLWLARLDNGAI